MKSLSKYQTKCRLRKGDKVIVLSGRSKGETGTIDKINKKSEKVFLAGVNIYKKHTKPSSQDDLGGIIDKVMPLHLSNVALLDPKKNKATRIGFKDAGTKSKTRFAKLSGTAL